MRFTDQERAFRPVSSNLVVLELAECRYIREVHQLLKKQLGLPDDYGENWDGLWDCLDGLFDDCGDVLIRVCGFYALNEELQEVCAPMLEVFDDLEAEYPNVRVEVVP